MAIQAGRKRSIDYLLSYGIQRNFPHADFGTTKEIHFYQKRVYQAVKQVFRGTLRSQFVECNISSFCNIGNMDVRGWVLRQVLKLSISMHGGFQQNYWLEVSFQLPRLTKPSALFSACSTISASYPINCSSLMAFLLVAPPSRSL
jgi:hypothetical protein